VSIFTYVSQGCDVLIADEPENSSFVYKGALPNYVKNADRKRVVKILWKKMGVEKDGKKRKRCGSMWVRSTPAGKIRTKLLLEIVLNIKKPELERSQMREVLRYLNNAKEILKGIPIENNIYTDLKHVREAFGTAYLAILEAINESLIKKGITKKDLPKSMDAYRMALRKNIAVHDGKLLREFEMLHDALHIAGYYRGLTYNVDMVKDALKAAKSFIEKLG